MQIITFTALQILFFCIKQFSTGTKLFQVSPEWLRNAPNHNQDWAL